MFFSFASRLNFCRKGTASARKTGYRFCPKSYPYCASRLPSRPTCLFGESQARFHGEHAALLQRPRPSTDSLNKSKSPQVCGPQSCELNAFPLLLHQKETQIMDKPFVYGMSVEGGNFTDRAKETTRFLKNGSPRSSCRPHDDMTAAREPPTAQDIVFHIS